MSPNSFGQERPQSAAVRRPSDRSPSKLEERIHRAVSKIAQGLHVALLGASAGEMRKREADGEPIKHILRAPCEENVCRIFRHFLHLKEVEADRVAANKELRRQKDLEWGRPVEDPKNQEADDCAAPLSRLGWPTFFRCLPVVSLLVT